MKTYTIVNGPKHGETFALQPHPILGDYLYANRMDASVVNTYPEGIETQFTSHYMVRKYLLQGEYAYYISETAFYPNAVLPDYPPQEACDSPGTQNEELRTAPVLTAITTKEQDELTI